MSSTEGEAGANNDRMFPNINKTSEASRQTVFSIRQKPVWQIWSCPKKDLAVRISQGKRKPPNTLGPVQAPLHSYAEPY